MNPALNFLLKHWRPVAVVVAMAGSFVAGRLSAPTPAPQYIKGEDKLVIDEKKVEEEVQRRMRDFEAKFHQQTVKKKVTKKKDGTVTIETEATKTDLDTKEHEVEVKYVDRFVDRIVTQDHIVEVKTDTHKNWRVGVLLGTDVLNPALRIGVAGERHLGVVPIIKLPVNAGIWALSPGLGGIAPQPTLGFTVGLSLSGEF